MSFAVSRISEKEADLLNSILNKVGKSRGMPFSSSDMNLNHSSLERLSHPLGSSDMQTAPDSVAPSLDLPRPGSSDSGSQTHPQANNQGQSQQGRVIRGRFVGVGPSHSSDLLTLRTDKAAAGGGVGGNLAVTGGKELQRHEDDSPSVQEEDNHPETMSLLPKTEAASSSQSEQPSRQQQQGQPPQQKQQLRPQGQRESSLSPTSSQSPRSPYLSQQLSSSLRQSRSGRKLSPSVVSSPPPGGAAGGGGMSASALFNALRPDGPAGAMNDFYWLAMLQQDRRREHVMSVQSSSNYRPTQHPQLQLQPQLQYPNHEEDNILDDLQSFPFSSNEQAYFSSQGVGAGRQQGVSFVNERDRLFGGNADGRQNAGYGVSKKGWNSYSGLERMSESEEEGL